MTQENEEVEPTPEETSGGDPAAAGGGEDGGEVAKPTPAPGLMGDAQNGDKEGDGNEPPAFALPEGAEIPDHLKGKDDGETFENLLKAYAGLRDKGSKAPEDLADYQLDLAQEVTDVFPMADDDPLLKLAREKAQEVGLAPDAFKALMGGIVEGMVKQGIAEEPFDEATWTATQWDELGGREKALGQVQALGDWANGLHAQGILDDADLAEFPLLTGTAQGVKTIAKLRELTGEKPIPLGGMVAPGHATKEELDAMVADERYGRDSVYTAEVQKKFVAAYGEADGTQKLAS